MVRYSVNLIYIKVCSVSHRKGNAYTLLILGLISNLLHQFMTEQEDTHPCLQWIAEDRNASVSVTWRIHEANSSLKTAAIFGAGIAGLTIAHELIGRGYKVTVYESLSEAGGFFPKCQTGTQSLYAHRIFLTWVWPLVS